VAPVAEIGVEVPEHIVASPVVIMVGEGFTVIANVLAVLEPHALSAVTEMVPLVEPAVAAILFVMLLPDHPLGNVHVYPVAPDTAVIE